MENTTNEPNPYDIYKDYAKYERRYALKQFFIKGNLAWELKDEYRFIKRWFYFLKALICVFLKRYGLKSYGITVITYGEYSYPDCSSWQYVSVGSGLFKGWRISVGTDGT